MQNKAATTMDLLVAYMKKTETYDRLKLLMIKNNSY